MSFVVLTSEDRSDREPLMKNLRRRPISFLVPKEVSISDLYDILVGLINNVNLAYLVMHRIVLWSGKWRMTTFLKIKGLPYNDCNAMAKAHDTPYIAILEKIKAKQ
jgi:hypothetical protein